MDLFAKNIHKRYSKGHQHIRHHKSGGGSSDEDTGKFRSSKVSLSEHIEDAGETKKHRRRHRKSGKHRKDHKSKDEHTKDSEQDKDQMAHTYEGMDPLSSQRRINTANLRGTSAGTVDRNGEVSSGINGGYNHTEPVEHYVQDNTEKERTEEGKGDQKEKAGLVDMGTTVGTLQSTEAYLKTKELHKYEKEKKRKREKLRSEIEELQQQRENMKVALQMEQLKKEGDLLDKQKELNQFEENLLSRQEQLYEREREVKESLKQMEEAEGALERRQEIVQRKHEELTGMSMKQDLGNLKEQLEEQKEHLRRKSMDGSFVSHQSAQMNWDFLRGVFHDKTAILSGALKACKAELAHTENVLAERSKELQNSKTEVKNLQEVLNSKERKIKELEQHLTLTLQELKLTNKELRQIKEPQSSPGKEGKLFPKRPTRQSLKGLSNGQISHDSEKYVSQTCTIM